MNVNLIDQIHTKSKTIGVINALQKGEDFLVGHTYFVTQFSKLFSRLVKGSCTNLLSRKSHYEVCN